MTVFIPAIYCDDDLTYKTEREIELEKDIDRLSDRNAKLEEKLKIAKEALHTYANLLYDGSVKGYESIAKEALAKIDEQ